MSSKANKGQDDSRPLLAIESDRLLDRLRNSGFTVKTGPPTTQSTAIFVPRPRKAVQRPPHRRPTRTPGMKTLHPIQDERVAEAAHGWKLQRLSEGLPPLRADGTPPPGEAAGGGVAASVDRGPVIKSMECRRSGTDFAKAHLTVVPLPLQRDPKNLATPPLIALYCRRWIDGRRAESDHSRPCGAFP